MGDFIPHFTVRSDGSIVQLLPIGPDYDRRRSLLWLMSMQLTKIDPATGGPQAIIDSEVVPFMAFALMGGTTA